MISQVQIIHRRIELAQLLGWTRTYDSVLDPDALNWTVKEGTQTKLVVADWDHNPAAAMGLLIKYTTGYYETRQRTDDHCIVIGAPWNTFFESTVVYLRHHKYDKSRALGYAAMLAAIKQLKANNGQTSERIMRVD